MKKTYLIKDKGRGLIENLTPDKLFDIASGNPASGVDNSHDYSVDEIQVGKFIYISANGFYKVSKPKYRKMWKIYGDDTNTTQVINISETNLDIMNICKNDVTYTNSGDTNHGYSPSLPYSVFVSADSGNGYNLQIVIAKNEVLNTVNFFTVILEYIKTTDEETIIEVLSQF